MELEYELDKILKIKTSGRDDSNSNYLNFPYEPTPYAVLQELSNSGYVNKNDNLLDYGCGKGRVGFYLAYANKINYIGIEYDERIYNSAINNKNTSIIKNKVSFINVNALDYIVPENINKIYFFNPFSVKILVDVIANIRESLKINNRTIQLFFYYPSDGYLKYLNNEKDIEFIEEINCQSVVNSEDLKEYIAVYEIKNN